MTMRRCPSHGGRPRALVAVVFLSLLACSPADGTAAGRKAKGEPDAGDAAQLLGIVNRRLPPVVVDPQNPPPAVVFEDVEIVGFDRNRHPRIFLGDVEGGISITVDSPGSTRVKAQFPLPRDLEPGERNLRVEQGDQVYVFRSAVRLVLRPRIGERPCREDQTVEFAGGRPMEIFTPGESTATIRVRLDEAELPVAPRGEGTVRFTLPPGAGEAQVLTVELSDPRFGPVELCRQVVRILEPGPAIEGLALTYEPGNGTVELEARGARLPDAFQGVFTAGDAGRPLAATFEGVGGEGGARTYRSVPGLAQEPGRFTTFEIHAGDEVLFEVSGLWTAEGPGPWRWRRFASRLEADLTRIFEGEDEGTIAIGGGDLALARIPAGEYLLGLAPEHSADPRLVQYNLAGPSSSRDGPLKVRLLRPFLMGIHEVTNREFLRFARAAKPSAGEIPESLRPYLDSELPTELADLPASGLSFVAARRYADWLQAEIDRHTNHWRFRLPHEVEWEMAARGGSAMSYAFKDDDQAQGLASLRRSGPRPVGRNPWDRSLRGVWDLTGNVREWTTTVYEERMLALLDFHLKAGIEGWDPARPIPELFDELPEDLTRISHNLTVRGGANGEDPALCLVSLRRQMEMASADPEVGFRLVLVPRDDGG